MNFIMDIIIVCVIVLFALFGMKKGFIRTAVNFVGSIVAAFLSAFFGEQVATWVFNSFFRTAIIENVNSTITGFGGADAVGKVIDGMPDFLVRTLEFAGVTRESLIRDAAVHQGEISEMVADALAPVLIGILKVLAMIVLFLIFMMLIRILANLLSTIVSLPILNQLNSILGGVFGFLRGAVIIWIVFAILQVFIPMFEPDTLKTWQDTINSSLFAGFFVNFNPLAAMFK